MAPVVRRSESVPSFRLSCIESLRFREGVGTGDEPRSDGGGEDDE
jgi:hypothetical protein